MKFRTLAAATAAVTLAAAPAVAQFERASAPIEGEAEMGGENTVLYSLLAIAAFAGAVYLITDSDDDPISA